MNSENIPWVDGSRSLSWGVFSGSNCSDPLPSWEICGISGENGADFGESSPCSGMIDHDPIVWCL